MKNLSTLKSFMTTNFFPKQHISAYFKAHYFNELSILATFWWFYMYGLNFTVLLNTFQSFTHSLKLLHVYRVNKNRILGLDGILACLALVTMGVAGTCYPSDNGGGWDLLPKWQWGWLGPELMQQICNSAVCGLFKIVKLMFAKLYNNIQLIVSA